MKIIFLVEGDPNNLNNFSGIPYYLTRALLNYSEFIGIDVDVIDTSYLFNVEELLKFVDIIRKGTNLDKLMANETHQSVQKKLQFPLNNALLRNARELDEMNFEEALKSYYTCITEYLGKKLGKLIKPRDVLLSINHFFPYLGETFSIYYFLDTSLVDFYFNEKFGTILRYRQNQAVKSLYNLMERKALRKAEKVFCFSQALKIDLQQRHGISSDRLVVAGAGINFDSFPEPLIRKATFPFHLLFVGLDFQRKGGHILLKAMEMLRNEDIELTIVTSIEDLTELRVPEMIKLYGPCDKKRLAFFYRSADAFVFPTLFEPYGLVVCEAMSFSLPVIATKTFAISDILGVKDSVLLVEPNDAGSLAEAIRLLLNQPQLKITMAQHNYIRAKNLFQWEKVVGTIISECLANSIQ